MKKQFPGLAKRSLSLLLALALLLSICPALPITADAQALSEGWETAGNYSWLNGAFNTEDADLVYEEGQEYDWTVTVQQGKTTVDVDVQATITDANGSLVDQVKKTVTAYKSDTPSVILTAADFTKLTTDLAGEFTLVCDVLYKGSAVARMTQAFTRAGEVVEAPEVTDPTETPDVPETTEPTETPDTPEAPETTEPTEGETEIVIGWEVSEKYNWLVAAFTSADEDLAFEGEQPYDWTFTLQQARTNADLNVVATIVTKDGEKVGEINKTVTCYKSDVPSVMLAASEFPQIANLNGEFLLVCDVYFGTQGVGRMTQIFSRTGATDEGGNEGEGEGEETKPTDGWEVNEKYNWIVAAFNSADEDLVFEGTQAYDWTFTLQQAKATVDVNIKATIKNAKGETVSTVNKTTTAYKGETPTVVLSADEFAELTADLNGVFTLVCDVTYGTEAVGRLTQTFSRVNGTAEPTLSSVTAYVDPLIGVVSDPAGAVTVSGMQLSSGTPTPHKPSLIQSGALAAWNLPNTYGLLVTLSDEFFVGFDGNVTITVNYVDSSSANAQLIYRAQDGTDKTAEKVMETTGTNTMETFSATYTLTDAALVNTKDWGASFVVMIGGTGRFYISSVTVSKPVKEEGPTYTVELNSEVADLKFFDETPFDLALNATTDGSIEVVNVTYTLAGGNLTEALTETKTITLNKEGVNILNADWFTEKAIGFGDFTLEVTMTKEGEDGAAIELAKESFSFSRKMTSILNSELRSEIAEDLNGVLVFTEDAAIDAKLFLKNKLSEIFNGTITYTFSKNGTALEGFEGLTLEVAELTEGEFALTLPEAAEYGVYELAISVADAEGNEVHAKTFTFARVKAEFASAILSSATAGETLVFVDDAAYDLMLSVQKADGNDEELTISYEILKGEEVVKNVTLEKQTFSAASASEIALNTEGVEGFGTFTLKLTVTNALGCKQEFSYEFSRIESIMMDLASAGNAGSSLTYYDDAAFDLQVILKKMAGENKVFTVNYAIISGETELKSGSFENITVSEEAAVLNLDMAGIEGNGNFILAVALVDADGNTVKSARYQVKRVFTMNAELITNGAEEIDGKVTYIDQVPYDFSLSMQKLQAGTENVTVNYIVTDAEGNEVAAGTTSATVTSEAAVAAALDLSGVKDFGAYTLTVSVVDVAGNQVATASMEFARVEYIVSSLTSATNGDLVFTEGDAFDLALSIKNNNVAETLNVTCIISGGTLEVPYSYTTTLEDVSFEALVNDCIDLTALDAVGTFYLELIITDGADRLRENVTYTFYRVAKEGTIETVFSSESSAELVFVPGAIDLALGLKKLDGVAEGFTALLTITDKNGNELKKVETALDAFVETSLKLADLVDLSSISTSGEYTVNLTLTDNSGNVRQQASAIFTIVSLAGSVDAAVTSESNSDLIFTEGEEFDLVLHLRKNDGIAEAFKAVIVITDKNGNELMRKEASVPERTSIKVSVSDLLNIGDLPATGSFNLSMVLTDKAGNERLTLDQPFHRVKKASVKTQISSSTNKDMIFTDKDVVDLTLYVQKTDDVDEKLNIKYTVFDPNGAEIYSQQGNAVVASGSKYFKLNLEDLPELSEHGLYNIKLTVTDNSGIVRSETDTRLARISGSGIKHQVSGSSTGTKMQFTPGMKIDLCLFMQKTDGVAETLIGNLSVVDPTGAVIYSIKGNLNIPSTGYFKFSLPLDGKCENFGTYKVYYTMHDDAGNLRVSNSASFQMISPTGELAVAVKSASEKPGLIYTMDEPFDLVLYLQKADGVEQTLQVRYTISDMNGLVLETKQGKLALPAVGYRKIPIELPEIEAFNKYGVYTMKVEVAGPTGELLFKEEYPFSRVLTPETQLDIMGVCTHLSKRGMSTKQSQMYVDLAREAGISFWRDELPWSSVEPSKGTYYFSAAADAAVDYTKSIGLEPLFILDYGNDNYGSDVTTDEWLEGYLGYVRAMVTHFKGRVMYYEVWNEWNIGLGGMDKKYRDMADVYANLLIETYKVIKEIDPEVTVIGGVVAGGEEKWIEKMLQTPDVLNHMDVFSFHEYPDNDVKELVEQTEKVRELMVEYGRPDIPLWITETGWPTHVGRASFTEEASAGNLVSLYTWAIANPNVVDRIFWYDLHNDGLERENAEHNFGLLGNWTAEENIQMHAKPSYVALCAMNYILGDAEYVGEYDLGHKKITAYHFKKDGKDLLVAWADDSALNMIANIGNNNIIVTDMYGNSSALTPVDGKVSLFFSDAPIYIEFDLENELNLVEGGFKLDQNLYKATPGANFPVQITRNNGLETQAGSYVFSMPETWSVEGIEFGAAEAGATEIVDTVYISVGEDALKGNMTITSRVVIDGNVVGQFNVPIEMGDICTVNPDVIFTENGPEFKLSVQIINENSTKPLTGKINLLEPAKLIGEASTIDFEVPAGENKAVLIDVPAEVANHFYNVKVEVVLGSGAKHEVLKPMSFFYAIEAPEDMKLDGVIDEQWDDAMEFSIGEDEWYNTTDSDAEWPGNTAKGYAMWDAEYLYVAVQAHDASHYQVGTGTSIWMGDSIQLTTDISRFTVPAYYGYNEIGFSLNSENGAIENWNWFASPGKNVSEGGIFKIVRDDAAEVTTYEVALPWAELLPPGVEFDFRSIGFSLLVNENSIDEDGEPTGRTGWIEYMSGIGYRKEPEKFGDLILVNRSEIQ